MNKVIFMGKSGCGKTTLAQRLNNQNIEYKKTQAIDYVGDIVDTPGEYIENKAYYRALIISSYDSDVVALVKDATEEETIFPPNFAAIFNKPIIGIITKIDKSNADVDKAIRDLETAGCNLIVKVSAKRNMGIDNLKEALEGL